VPQRFGLETALLLINDELEGTGSWIRSIIYGIFTEKLGRTTRKTIQTKETSNKIAIRLLETRGRISISASQR
jgi:hypothetical protein